MSFPGGGKVFQHLDNFFLLETVSSTIHKKRSARL